MRLQLLIALSLLPCSCYSSTSGPDNYQKRVELQSLDVDFRGVHISNEFQLINHGATYERKTKAYSITGVVPLLINNNDLVQISFTSTKPESTDWIGAYSPADVDVSKTVPVKYALCGGDTNYLDTGAGILNFNFTNLRADVAFHYFTGSLVSPVLVATFAKTVSFENMNEPLRPRVVPMGSNDPDTFKVLWSSASSTAPTLKWGVVSGELLHSVKATTGHIEKSQMCGGVANSTGWRDLGLTHTALLSGMTALGGRSVYYMYGDEHTQDYSAEMVFFVPTPKGVILPSRPTKVILYDDMGRGTDDDSFTWNEYGRPSFSTAAAVGHEVAQGDVDAIYHGGDISYACGYAAVWDFFLNMISPISSSVLYLTTVGNHESDFPLSDSYYRGTDSGGECGVMALTLLPQPYPASTNKPWWSYDIGLIHFVGMSTEHDFRVGSEQHSWLEEDLRTVDRTVTPWIIFGGHRAMYINSAFSDKGVTASDTAVMDFLILHVEPLLFKYRVNIGFYGHNHVVQRQSAVFNKKVIQKSVETLHLNGDTVHSFTDPQATVHMVIGTAGAGFTKNAIESKPVWNEVYFYRWGYARVSALSATELSWEWVESSSGTVFDRMSLTQVLDFDTKPHWILSDTDSDTDSGTGTEKESDPGSEPTLLSANKEESSGWKAQIQSFFKTTPPVFILSYAVMLVIIILSLLLFVHYSSVRIMSVCFSSSASPSESYEKLPVSNPLRTTILDIADTNDGAGVYRQIL